MATHKSAEKRAAQNVNRNVRNTALRSRIKTAIKAVEASVSTKNKEEAVKSLQSAMPAILVENAYMIFPEQEALLNDSVFRDELAKALVEGIGRFLRSARRQS